MTVNRSVRFLAVLVLALTVTACSYGNWFGGAASGGSRSNVVDVGSIGSNFKRLVDIRSAGDAKKALAIIEVGHQELQSALVEARRLEMIGDEPIHKFARAEARYRDAFNKVAAIVDLWSAVAGPDAAAKRSQFDEAYSQLRGSFDVIQSDVVSSLPTRTLPRKKDGAK